MSGPAPARVQSQGGQQAEPVGRGASRSAQGSFQQRAAHGPWGSFPPASRGMFWNVHQSPAVVSRGLAHYCCGVGASVPQGGKARCRREALPGCRSRQEHVPGAPVTTRHTVAVSSWGQHVCGSLMGSPGPRAVTGASCGEPTMCKAPVVSDHMAECSSRGGRGRRVREGGWTLSHAFGCLGPTRPLHVPLACTPGTVSPAPQPQVGEGVGAHMHPVVQRGQRPAWAVLDASPEWEATASLGA